MKAIAHKLHLEVLDLGDIKADAGEQGGVRVHRHWAVDEADAGNILKL